MSNFLPWKVYNVELSQEIPTLPVFPGYGQLYIVFWWHGIPLGHQEVSVDSLPMSAAQLAKIAVQTIAPAVGSRLLSRGFDAPLPQFGYLSEDRIPEFHELAALEQPLTKLQKCLEPVSDISVSVVICTRDRPEQLAKCLQSLQELSKPPKEIVVVDNAPSTEATCELVTQMPNPNIKYVREPRPGLDIARNTGIRHSTGEVIAFTDDDVIVHPDWIARIQQSFSSPHVMAMTGLVLAAEIETETQFIFEKFWGFNRGYCPLTYDTQYFAKLKPWGVPAWDIGAGANMAFRKEIFERAGDFDERLDVGAAGCSGDSEFWYRVLAEGGSCLYEPSAVVYHYHRRHLDSFKKQMFYYMRGHVTALLIQFEKYQHWGNLRRLFRSLPKWYIKLLVKGLRKGFKSRYSTLFAEIAGCFSGVNFYLQNRPSIQNTPYKVEKPGFSKKLGF
jgi:glycosyltransferase involved in cell wall biosynthesis